VELIEQFLLKWIEAGYAQIQWPGVVILMAIESACIPVPSELIMPLAGWMLIKNQGLDWTYTFIAALWGGLGNTLGSLIAYVVGMWGGRPLLEKWGKYILVSHHDLATADRWFARYGSLAAFLSRLMPVVRTFISLPMGIARTNLPKFLVYTFLGSVIWSWVLAYIGFQLGEHWESIREVIRPFDWVIIAALAALIGYYIYRHVRHARNNG
jgi:membrane protein DedA with SNARE-associated domain